MPEFQIDKKIKDKIIITNPSELVDKPTDNFPFTRAEKVKLAELGSGSGGNQIYIGELPPTDPNILLWVDTSEPLSDVDILRAIRDANPQSTQLAALFNDNKDPYTEWYNPETYQGALFGGNPNFATLYTDDTGNDVPTNVDSNRCYVLVNEDYNLTTLNITGLTALKYLRCGSNQLTTLDCTGLTALQDLQCYSNQLTTLDVTGLTALQYLQCSSNQLTSLDCTGLTALQDLQCVSNQLTSIGITEKGLITILNIRNNNLPQTEIDRLVALGFDINNILPQNVQS